VDALVQGSFLESLLREMDGFVVLDLHNLYCQTQNFDIDPVALIESYPLDLVRELHISGGSTSPGTRRESVRRDTHDDAVPEAVFEMAELALRRCPQVEAIVLERLGGTIATEGAAETFRLDFHRLLDLRNEVKGSDLAKPAGAMASPVPEPEGAPMHDEALAAFQARLLTSFYASSASDEIMAALRGAPECQPFSSYLDTFDPDMVEVAALLTKKWARR
jgi:hypothetical protein